MESRILHGNVATALKILLVGPKRTGKSSTGNTLLGRGQVFDTRGGGASIARSAFTAGRHLTVVDAQGWGSSEEFVPREEKVEQLRALSLCGAEGPHIVLLIFPVLDFTEQERRAVERRMEVYGSWVWRHTMVVFTFGDCLNRRACSAQEHISSGGPALQWLMEKCRYRYHVLDNKAAVTGKRGLKQEVNRSGRKLENTWWKKDEVRLGRVSRKGEADVKRELGQKQVREMLSKIEDILQENGGWHFSLHMYQRLEEEWSRRESELRAWLKADVGNERGKQKREETKVKAEPEQEHKLEEALLEQSLWKERRNDCEESRRRGKDEEVGVGVELRRLSSEGGEWYSSSDSVE